MIETNNSNVIAEMAAQRLSGVLDTPAPTMAAIQRSSGIERIANSVQAAELADAMRHRQAKRAFENGGKIDPEALLAQMKNKYGVGNSSTPAAQPAPAAPAVQQPQPRAAAPVTPTIQGAANAFRNNAAQLKEAMGYARGGKIQGPGTTTSDSIPAKVKESGEDILVSKGERILSAKQDQLLHRIAMERGFDSVEAMLEAGTGEPVGPSIKAGKKAAAQGDKIDIDGVPHIDTGTEPAGPVSMAANAAAGTLSFLNPIERGIESRRESNRAGLNTEGQTTAPSSPAPVTDSQQHPVSVPASRAAGAGLPAPSPILGPTATALTTKDIVPGGFTDRGAGIVGSRDANGLLNVTNVGTEGFSDKSSPILDGSASALIDQKNSTYNPARQLANMQRLRMMSDATDPTITDPDVKTDARAALASMSQGEQTAARKALETAQAGLVGANTEQAEQMETMRGKLLDPNTPQEERTRMIQALQTIHGTAQRPYQVHDVEQPIDPANPLLGNRKVPHRFDPITGTLEPLNRPGDQNGDAIAQAKAAIARGANKAAVNARLKSLGLPEIK